MGWLLLAAGGLLFWAGPQIAIAGGAPGFVGAFIYLGWVFVLLALLRWLLPLWHPVLRLLLALFIPIAIAAIVLGVWLRALRGRD